MLTKRLETTTNDDLANISNEENQDERSDI